MTQLTVKRWNKEINWVAVLVLFGLLISTIVFSVHNNVLSLVNLKMVLNSTSTTESTNFNVGAVFIFAIVFQIVGHCIAACKETKRIEKGFLEKINFDSRSVSLYVAFPLVHAAVLVGVAQVIDSWAVFSSFLLTLLILMNMSLFNKGVENAAKLIYFTTFVVISLYITFWILAWRSGEHTHERTAKLGAFTYGLTFLLLIYFAFTRRWNTLLKRACESTKSTDEKSVECYRLLLLQEGLYVCTSVGLMMISVTTWICHTSSDDVIKKVTVAVTISSILQIMLCVFVFKRLSYVEFDAVQLQDVKLTLLNEPTYDSESDSETDTAALVLDPEPLSTSM